MWIKNTDGKKDAVLTMALVGFIVVLVKLMFGGTSIEVANGTTVTINAIDASAIGAILTPTLGAYVLRRYTDKKYNVDLNNNGKIDPEEEVDKEG